MFATTPIRIFLLAALVALGAFAAAAWTAGAPAAVLVATVASFLAAAAVIVEVENGDQAADGGSVGGTG